MGLRHCPVCSETPASSDFSPLPWRTAMLCDLAATRMRGSCRTGGQAGATGQVRLYWGAPGYVL